MTSDKSKTQATKAIIYCRKPTGQAATTLAEQERHCQSFAVQHGFGVSKVCIEEYMLGEPDEDIVLPDIVTSLRCQGGAGTVVIVNSAANLADDRKTLDAIQHDITQTGASLKIVDDSQPALASSN